MIFCHRCASPIEEDAVFCPICGASLRQPEVYSCQPQAYPANDPKWAAITALVLGIVSTLLPCMAMITGVLAVIFGIIGIKSSQKAMSIIGLVFGAVGLLLFLLIVSFYIYMIVNLFEEIPGDWYDYQDVIYFVRALVI